MTLAQDAIPLARYAVTLFLTTPLRSAQGDGLRLDLDVILALFFHFTHKLSVILTKIYEFPKKVYIS